MIFKERQSIYLQIADRISDEILAGTYAPGARVPSVREYAVMIEVNLNTVMRSYDTLQSWGILDMKRGLGYFVADDAVQTILARRREAFMPPSIITLWARTEVKRSSSRSTSTPGKAALSFTTKASTSSAASEGSPSMLRG